MKILHLYANHKWTGPAELAIQQVLGLARAGPYRAELAIAGHHDPARPHAIQSRCRELRLPVREGLRLRKHFHAKDVWRDAGMLARWIDAGDVDLLHCHLAGDHVLAAVARHRARRRVPLLRSYWDHAAPGAGPRPWFAFRRTDRVLAPFDGLATALVQRFPRLADRIFVQPPVLPPVPEADTADVHAAREALRAELSLGPESVLIGLTARIQPRRRWTLAWDVMARLARRHPNWHLCVLGRADEGVFDRLCRRPLAERGITHRVHFLGYRRNEAYYEALRAFDAFLFLVPGSDATCRALREAMAMGLPAVTTDLGHLPEIVDAERTGLVAPAEDRRLADCLERLLSDIGLRERLGRAASHHASCSWQPSGTARALAGHYGELDNP